MIASLVTALVLTSPESGKRDCVADCVRGNADRDAPAGSGAAAELSKELRATALEDECAAFCKMRLAQDPSRDP